ncbi:hypothetical protein [Streptomyces sp. TRM70350]|uniref:hypothetical protein n=1 Tax=Streptomyces sp. TRM70350 TaxID=2856165 RepID=UPI00210FE233|nr:hypothetical protein [Streptomyces sp. TRM70350]
MPASRRGTVDPATAPRAGSPTTEGGPASTSATRRPGIHQPLKCAFGIAERGLHPLGLLPQPRDLFPDPLLPGLQQTEHRRH